MVQKKHYDLIQQGIGVWNKWRQANPTVTPDLEAANLSRTNLATADLNGARMAGANLSAAYLDRASLKHADLKGANLSYASLTWADLTDANLNNADLRFAQLHGAQLVCADLTGADISFARLEKTNTAEWIITNIRCTEIIDGGECITCHNGLFEKAYPRREQVVQIILDTPASVLTHYFGQLIELFFNRYYGGAALEFKGQERLANGQTTQKYILLKAAEKEKIKNRLDTIKTGLDAITGTEKAREIISRIKSFSSTVPSLTGYADLDQDALLKAMDYQYELITPLLKKTIRAINRVLKNSPA